MRSPNRFALASNPDTRSHKQGAVWRSAVQAGSHNLLHGVRSATPYPELTLFTLGELNDAF